MKRRNFIFDIFSVGLISSITPRVKAKNFKINNMVRSISTWKAPEANLKAGLMLDKGIDGLCAAVAGVAIEEENPKNTIMQDKPKSLTYIIQKGDLLSEIAIRFGVTVDELISQNKINPKRIYPGQKIKINI